MTRADHHRVRLRGTVAVQVPPAEAIELFTPSGERRWAEGWDPSFPAPVADETEPGTVFETDAHGSLTWVVVDRENGRRMRYAVVAPESGRARSMWRAPMTGADGRSRP